MTQEKRLRTKNELKRLFTNLKRRGITDEMIAILIDVLWRDKPTMRTSGFYWPGAPDMSMTWDNADRTLTVQPYTENAGSAASNPHYRFYSWAEKPVYHRRYGTDTIELPDQEGLYLIFFQADEETREQELTYIKDPTYKQQANVYLTKVAVTWIYWNSQAKRAEYHGDERHGSEWIPSMHWWAHQVFNARREYGVHSEDIIIGDGSQNSHAQVGISAGMVWHEDIYTAVDSIDSSQGIPILYRTAIGPRFTAKSGFPVINQHLGQLYYNNGGSLTKCDEGRFTLCHIFWTNCLLKPVIAIMGQAQYDDALGAIQGFTQELESLREWVPHQTRLHITTLVYETSTDFSNSVHARIVGEMTPEGIADIVSKENIPALKTGWHPDILEHTKFIYDETQHSLILGLLEDFTTYFVKGIKYKVIFDYTFLGLPDTLGMNYITGEGDSFTTINPTLNEHTTENIILTAFYRNVRLSQTPYLGWRMHIWEMDGRTRGNIIQETGLEHLSGLKLSINESELHKIDVTDGYLRLADIVADIIHNSGNTFGQYLRALRARRHWLITYIDETDPENPVITHEWEYQDSPTNIITALSQNNEVLINQFSDASWNLFETSNGDYTAMWLIATLDYAQPLKWITGTQYNSDLDEAKELNDPESLLSVIETAQFITDHYEVLARVIIKNIPDDPYYEIIEINQYEDGKFEDLVTDLYVEDAQYVTNDQKLILKRTGDLPDLEVTIGTNNFQIITQPSHGFVKDQVVRLNGSTYVLAQADNDTNAQSAGFVAEVIDENTFKLQSEGFLPGDWVSGQEYFLSPSTPGQAIPEPEYNIGEVRQSLGWGTTEGLKIEIDVGDVIGSFVDSYVDGMEFNPETGDLTLKRTNNLPNLVENLDNRYPTQENVSTQIENNNTNILPTLIQSGIEGYKEAFLIENTINNSETQASTWGVILFNELIGEFKAMVMIRNKNDHSIVSLMNILSFDYTDSSNEVSRDNQMLTDSTITLALEIDPGTRLFFATISNMPSDAKRIHFCFERCVLGSRPRNISAELLFQMDMNASIILIRNIRAEMNMAMGMEVTLENGIVPEEPFLIQLNVTDYTWDYIYLTMIANGTLEIHDGEGNIYNKNTLEKDDWGGADGAFTSNAFKDIEIYKGTCSPSVQKTITYIDLSLSDSYINDIDLSNFENLNYLLIVAYKQNGGIILPNSNNDFIFFNLKRVGYSGVMDLSNYTFSGEWLALEYCSNITGVNLPATGTFTTFRIVYCDLLSLDLSALTLSGELVVSGNGLNSITLPATAGAFTKLSFDNNDLCYIDFTVMPNCLKANNCNVFLNNNGFTTAEINHILVDLAGLVAGESAGGDYTGRKIWNRMTGQTLNSAPDSSSGGYDGLQAKADLQDKGFIIYT
jgi:hypothetical protein